MDNLEAGPEIDKLIHESVMGLQWDECLSPSYSFNIAAAWEVVEKLYDTYQDWTITILVTHDSFFQTECVIETNNYNWERGIGSRWWGSSSSAPLAICRAALKAVAPKE